MPQRTGTIGAGSTGAGTSGAGASGAGASGAGASDVTPDAARQAATSLEGALRNRAALAALPPGCAPTDHDEAYLVQDAWAALGERPVAGWKVGATSAAALAMLSTDRPFAGRILGPSVLDSPARFAAATGSGISVEGELAFVLGRDLAPRGRPYDRDEVAAAVATLRPAIEIVGSRLADWPSAGLYSLIADNGGNAGLVLGPAVAGWEEHDLSSAPVRMNIDGETAGSGSSGDAMGHPLQSLAWLANHLADRGQGLVAGQVVTTGSCTGIAPLAEGATAVADFGQLGRVELRHG